MGFFGFFKQKRHDFSDEDRAKAEQMSSLRAEIKRLNLEREAELAKLRYEKQKESLIQDLEDLRGIEDGGGDNQEFMDLAFLMKFLGNPNGAVGVTPSTILETPTAVHISNEQILLTLKGLPHKYIKIAKNMDDNALKTVIKTQMPAVDDDSLTRAVHLIKEY